MEITILNEKNELIASIKTQEKIETEIIWDKEYKVLIDGVYQEIKN